MPKNENKEINSKYPNIPEIPDEILSALDNRKLVVFIGAGISALFGLPNWKNMARQILEEIHNEKPTLIPYSSKVCLENETDDPRRLLSIIQSICEDDEYFKQKIIDILERKCDDHNLEGMINILNRWASPIVTTNYDALLEENIEGRNTFSSCKEFKPDENSKKLYIMHLHGSKSVPESMIVTASEYYTLYHDKNDEYGAQGFLDDLFRNNVVLFIGYGLRDNEIIEYAQKHKRGPYFVLEPHTRMDEPVIEDLIKYYDSINIRMLPYFIDIYGYKTVIDVIQEWDSKIQRMSCIPARTHSEIDSILSKEPNDSLIKALLKLINDDDGVLIYFLKKVNDSAFKHQWIKSVIGKEFTPEWMIKKISEDKEFAPRRLLIYIYEILNENDDEELKKAAIRFIELLTNGDCPIKPDCIYVHHCCIKLIVLLMDSLDVSVMRYIEVITSLDIYSSLIIDSICDSPDHFFKLRDESKITLLKHIIEHSVTNTHLNNEYYLNMLFDVIDGKIEPHIWNNLFTTISKTLCNYADCHPWSGLEIGSIDKYLNEDVAHNEVYYLVKFFKLSINNNSRTDLENFVTEHLNHNSHLISTLSLHTININFNNLQSIFWGVEDYSNLNYSELYDLIIRNVDLFDPEKLTYFVDVVKKSFNDGFKGEDAHICRYDLISLIPNKTKELEEYLLSIRYEESAIKSRPEDRGKLEITTSWVVNYGDPNKFNNIYEVIDVANHPSVSIEDEKSIEKYLQQNIDELLNRPDLLGHIPIQYLYVICNSLENIEDNAENVFEFYKIITERYIDTNIHNVLNSILCLKRWADKTNCSKELCEYLILILQNNVRQYCEETVKYDEDAVQESLNNWFTRILWILLTALKDPLILPIMAQLLKIIDTVNDTAGSDNKLLVNVAVAARWDLIESCNIEWADENYQSVLFHPSAEPISVYITHTSKFNKNIFNGILEKGLAEKMLDKPYSNRGFCNVPMSVGIHSIYALHNYKDEQCLKLIRYGLASPNNSNFISGVLRELNSKDEIDDDTSSKVLELIIEEIPQDVNPLPFLTDLSQYLESNVGDIKIKLRLMKKITTLKITRIPMKLIETLAKLSKNHPEIVDIALDLVKQPTLLDDTFKELIKTLIKNNADDPRMKEICNLANPYFDYEFDEYLNN